MRALLFLCFLGIAAASDDFDFHKRAVAHELAIEFEDGMNQAISLREALDIDDPVLDRVEREFKNAMYGELTDKLEKWISKLQEEISRKKISLLEILSRIEDKYKEYKEKGVDIKADLQKLIKDILQKFKEGFGKGDKIRQAAAMDNFRDQLDKKLREMFYNLAKTMRDYIAKVKTDNPDLKEAQEVARKLDDDDIKELVNLICDAMEKDKGKSAVSHSETWDKIKDYFKKVGLELKEKAKKLKEWIQEHLNKGLDKLKDKHEALKRIANELIDHAKDIKAEVAREALEFLRPYKKDLGDLWNQLVAGLRDALKREE